MLLLIMSLIVYSHVTSVREGDAITAFSLANLYLDVSAVCKVKTVFSHFTLITLLTNNYYLIINTLNRFITYF